MTREEAMNLIWDFEDEVIRCERDGYKNQSRRDRELARDRLIDALTAGDHSNG